MYQAGNVAAQVQLRMESDRVLPVLVACPGEERKAKVDRGGIKSIGSLGQLYGKVIGSVEISGGPDQDLSEVGVDMPVAFLVGIG